MHMQFACQQENLHFRSPGVILKHSPWSKLNSTEKGM